MKKMSKNSNVGIKPQIDAFAKFNNLRNKIYVVEFYNDLEDSLHETN